MIPDYLSPTPYSIETLSNNRVKLAGLPYEKLALAIYRYTLEIPYQTYGQAIATRRHRAENIPMAQIRLAEALVSNPKQDYTQGLLPSALYEGEQLTLEYELYWIGKNKRLEIFVHANAIPSSRLLVNTANNIGQLAIQNLTPIDQKQLRKIWTLYTNLQSYFYDLCYLEKPVINRTRVSNISETIWTLTHLDHPLSHIEYVRDSLDIILNKWHVPKKNLEEAWQKAQGNVQELKYFLTSLESKI